MCMYVRTQSCGNKKKERKKQNSELFFFFGGGGGDVPAAGLAAEWTGQARTIGAFDGWCLPPAHTHVGTYLLPTVPPSRTMR